MYKPFNQATLQELGFTVRDFNIHAQKGYKGRNFNKDFKKEKHA